LLNLRRGLSNAALGASLPGSISIAKGGTACSLDRVGGEAGLDEGLEHSVELEDEKAWISGVLLTSSRMKFERLTDGDASGPCTETADLLVAMQARRTTRIMSIRPLASSLLRWKSIGDLDRVNGVAF